MVVNLQLNKGCRSTLLVKSKFSQNKKTSSFVTRLGTNNTHLKLKKKTITKKEIFVFSVYIYEITDCSADLISTYLDFFFFLLGRVKIVKELWLTDWCGYSFVLV